VVRRILHARCPSASTPQQSLLNALSNRHWPFQVSRHVPFASIAPNAGLNHGHDGGAATSPSSLKSEQLAVFNQTPPLSNFSQGHFVTLATRRWL
jgi:hypothetical protein